MIDMIRDKTGATIRLICSALNLSRSSYYQASKPTKSEMEDQQIGDQIERIFRKHLRRYGYRRIHDDLKDLEIECGPARVRRIMKARGLHAIQPKNYIPRTSDGRADQPSSNLLLDRADPTRINEVWVGDITFIPTSAGWRYLAVVIDLCSRKVVGWSLADHLRADLVSDALRKSLKSRRATGNVIFHSDRGSQYGSTVFRGLLTKAGITQSMSRRANPYDNAWTESFIGTLKREMLQGGCFIDENDARTEIFSFIDGYYNTERKHSALGYLSPSKFESILHQN
jgi:transposase InsO family protein